MFKILMKKMNYSKTKKIKLGIVSYQTFGIYVSNHLSYTFVSKIDSK